VTGVKANIGGLSGGLSENKRFLLERGKIEQHEKIKGFKVRISE
jgi:hypothetical protein